MVKSKAIIYYFLTLIITLSGNVFFSLKYTNETRKILIVSSILLLIYKVFDRTIILNLKNILYFLFFLIVISMNFLANSMNGIILNNMLMLIGILFSVFIVKQSIDYYDFKHSYIKFIKWTCIISLICYTLSNFISIDKFPFFRSEILGVDSFMYSFYYCWGWGVGTTRNPGMFWEPGAFQCYINLAIIIWIFDKDITKKKSDLIVFIITLITTQSTTGYIILMVITLYSILTKKIKTKSRFKTFAIIAMCMVGVFYMSKSDIIGAKFNNSNTSYNIRQNDLTGSFNIIKKYPIDGVGYGSDLQVKEQQEYGIEKNSNGLLIFAIQFGFPTLCIYCIYMFRGIKNIMNLSKIDTIFIVLTLVVMFNSEPIMTYPLWLYLLI